MNQRGKYRRIAELARGGVGTLYLAVGQGPAGFNKLVVIKELKAEFCDDETYVAMFHDEARLAARLNHPNIVQTNEVGSDGSAHFMVMEYLDGRSLQRILQRIDRVPLGVHVQIIAEALVGLHHAHELRDFDGRPLEVVHRDLSPANVFLTFSGQVKLLDFGMAKTLDASTHTPVGILKGRVAYMAPEQARGGPVDRRADIYSAGVMLWEAAAQRRLWPEMTEIEILTRMAVSGPPSLRSVCPDAPDDLVAICARAMALEPEARYPTALDLLRDLEAHLAGRRDTMTMRDMGALFARAFADERERMEAAVEQALTRIRAERSSEGLAGNAGQTFHGSRGFLGPLPSQKASSVTDFRSSSQPPPLPAPRVGGRVSPSARLSRSVPPVAASLRPMAMPPPEARSRLVVPILASAGVVLLGGALGVASWRAAAAPASPPAPVLASAPAFSRAPAAPSAPPSAVVALDDETEQAVELVVRVTPATAQISVDGAPLAGNPVHARYPRDGRVHQIEASAPGYETRTERAEFTSDVSIDVSLARSASPSARSAPAKPRTARAPEAANPPAAPRPEEPITDPAASALSAAAPLDSSAPRRPPVRPIATTNPYDLDVPP